MGKKIIDFMKRETILCISLVLAAVSSIFVHIDRQYTDYIDWNTLMLLFCLMAVMAGARSIGVFDYIGASLLSHTKNTRQLFLILVFLPMFFSMFITNDVALITFVPFSLIVLRLAGREDLLITIVVLQTIAANLGSMLTPMGNPQNLYLYAKSHYTLIHFISVTLPYTLIAAICLFFCCISVKKQELPHISLIKDKRFSSSMVTVYSIAFITCLLCVAGLIPEWLLTIFIIVLIFICDKRVFLQVDYSLLLTFIGFFVFIGNMGRMDIFRNIIENIIENKEVPVSILSSQLISNVPAALLLSGFSDNYEQLIVGINLGGLGTLIASMASLISYKQIAREYPGKKGSYFAKFTYFSILFLVILLGFHYLYHEFIL